MEWGEGKGDARVCVSVCVGGGGAEVEQGESQWTLSESTIQSANRAGTA